MVGYVKGATSLVSSLIGFSDPTTDLFVEAARHWLAERDRQRPMLETELAGARQQLAAAKDGSTVGTARWSTATWPRA